MYPTNGTITETTIKTVTKNRTLAVVLTGIFSVLFLAFAVLSFVLYKKDQHAEANERDGGLLENEVEDQGLNQL